MVTGFDFFTKNSKKKQCNIDYFCTISSSTSSNIYIFINIQGDLSYSFVDILSCIADLFFFRNIYIYIYIYIYI